MCAERIDIAEGLTPFSTIGATTDGPDYDGQVDCGDFGDEIVHNDIWFNYTATCNGELTVTTCEELGGSANESSCSSCHAGGKGLENVAAVKKLSRAINKCIVEKMEGEKIDGRTVAMRSLKMYIKSLHTD